MKKTAQLYEGKAKKVFDTDTEGVVIVSYKDDATALDGMKKGSIIGKGAINNRMSNYLMQLLEKEGIPTHFLEELSDRETAVKKVSIVPLEVIVRNISAGSFAKRYGVEEGIVFDEPTIEFSIKTTCSTTRLSTHITRLLWGLPTNPKFSTSSLLPSELMTFSKNSLNQKMSSWWTLRWNSADFPTELWSLPMKSPLTPAVSGIWKPMKSLTRTDSDATWAV